MRDFPTELLIGFDPAFNCFFDIFADFFDRLTIGVTAREGWNEAVVAVAIFLNYSFEGELFHAGIISWARNCRLRF